MRDRQAKQVIVIRRDLKMRRGKEIAQGAHASGAWLAQRLEQGKQKSSGWWQDYHIVLGPAEQAWITGRFTKITCQVPDLPALLAVYEAAREAGLTAYLITDAGLTEFKEPTITALGIGPGWSDEVDKVTGELELY